MYVYKCTYRLYVHIDYHRYNLYKSYKSKYSFTTRKRSTPRVKFQSAARFLVASDYSKALTRAETAPRRCRGSSSAIELSRFSTASSRVSNNSGDSRGRQVAQREKRKGEKGAAWKPSERRNARFPEGSRVARHSNAREKEDTRRLEELLELEEFLQLDGGTVYCN